MCSKTKKRENKIKITQKKKGKENTKTEEARQHAADIPQRLNARKKQTKT